MARRSNAAAVAAATALALAGGLAPAGAGAAEPTRASASHLYALRCRGCHGPDGAGMPGGVPDLRGALTPFTRTRAGREYLVRVPGAAQAPLDDAELAAVLNWLVAEIGGGAAPGFVAYDAASVGRLRARPLIDVAAARRAALADGAAD